LSVGIGYEGRLEHLAAAQLRDAAETGGCDGAHASISASLSIVAHEGSNLIAAAFAAPHFTRTGPQASGAGKVAVHAAAPLRSPRSPEPGVRVQQAGVSSGSSSDTGFLIFAAVVLLFAIGLLIPWRTQRRRDR
jgi:hypothetical protein